MDLKIENFTKVNGNEKVFDGLSYTFVPNEIYLILGNNGSGKTTLLKCISTLDTVDSGTIIYKDNIINTRNALKSYRNKVSIFFNSSSSLIPDLTIMQNIKFFLKINNRNYKEVKEEIIVLIKKFNLYSKINEQVKTLSKGMKQKLALIITFLKKADIILLDEPYDGLDTDAIHVFNRLIRNYSNNRIIIMTSPHLINDEVITKIIYL